jgi:rubredoxin
MHALLIFLLTEGEEILEKWECTACGFVYDPEVGDQERGIERGTSFEKLPASWTCPVCGASKDQFVRKS